MLYPQFPLLPPFFFHNTTNTLQCCLATFNREGDLLNTLLFFLNKHVSDGLVMGVKGNIRGWLNYRKWPAMQKPVLGLYLMDLEFVLNLPG